MGDTLDPAIVIHLGGQVVVNLPATLWLDDVLNFPIRDVGGSETVVVELVVGVEPRSVEVCNHLIYVEAETQASSNSS
jgi:hypothetical protein